MRSGFNDGWINLFELTRLDGIRFQRAADPDLEPMRRVIRVKVIPNAAQTSRRLARKPVH